MDRLAIKSNHIIFPGGVFPGVVVIEDGIIIDIINSSSGRIQNMKDLGDKYLMPGLVDPHVHINEPGRTHWEGFETATRAALTGGVTTLIEMPLNARPVTTTVKALHEKIKAAENKLHVNCGFWGGIIPGNEKEIKPLAAHGVPGFKAFLTHSGIDDFPNVTEADLRIAMPIIAECSLPLLVHCELAFNNVAFKTGNPTSYQQYLSSRPKQWENDAIALMIRLCEEFGCKVHIVHLSSADAIEQIRIAKQKGLPLTVETAQHYLYFSAEEIKDGQTTFKCAPPIREKENNDLLWQALKEGLIDFVATDHSPAPPDMKQLTTGDFMKAWGGISSLQWALPVLWTPARQRGFKVTDVCKWLCENPAKIVGGKFKKGRIEKGYDADLIAWDPEKRFTVTEDIIQHKHKITPYLHHELTGVVEQVWLAGVQVFNHQQTVFNRGKVLLPARVNMAKG